MPLNAIRGICDNAVDLEQCCVALLELLAERFAGERALIFVRYGGRMEVAGFGFPPDLLSALLPEMRDRGSRLLPANGWTETEPLPRVRLEFLPDVSTFRQFPFESRGSDIIGLLLIESVYSDEEMALLASMLRQMATPLARVAELDVLRREAKRNQSESASMSAVLQAFPDPVVVLDSENRLILSNRRAEDLLVSLPEDSAGRRHAVETNNLFFSAFQAKTLLGARGGESRELFLVDPQDGSDLLFEVTSVGITAGGSSVTGEIHILRDITDLRRVAIELQEQYKLSLVAEHQARRESERLNVILANIGVPILVTDGWSDIILMNHRAGRLFEAPAGIRENSPRVSRVRANGVQLTGLISDFLLQPQQRREEELELVDPDGAHAFPARALLTKIANARGEPTAVVCVIDDLSEEAEIQRLAQELKQLNQDLEMRVEEATRALSERNRELERQRAELARASQLKTEFLAMMSHELRTPLNAILGYNALLKDGVLGELDRDQRHALDRVEVSSEHLLSLINDLLDLSKVEAGKIALQIGRIDTRYFVETISHTIRPMVENAGLEFVLEVGPEVPDVLADRTRLHQVILNLISNAVKFTERGRVIFRALAVSGGREVRFEVEDTGIGIHKDDLEAIFEPFHQVDRFETRTHGGSGLGLDISRKLLALMGGTLSVTSVHGEGSTFCAALPAVEVPEIATPA